MDAQPQPNETVSPPTTSAEPTATAPASGTSPWIAPPTAPEWAKGKTADEILALASEMANVIQRPQPAPPSPTPAPRADGLPSDEDWMRMPTDAAARVANAQFAPFKESMNGLAQMQAQTIRALAAQQYGDDFRRWSPEIDTAMAGVPLEQRTLDNYEKVVQFVRGKHVTELVEERARQMMTQGGLGERSGGSNGGVGVPIPGTYDPNKLPAGLGEVAKSKGLTEGMVQDFCRKNGWTVEKWMNEVQSGKVFTSVSPFSGEMRDDQLGITREYGS